MPIRDMLSLLISSRLSSSVLQKFLVESMVSRRIGLMRKEGTGMARVALVEDEVALRGLLQTYLERAGFTVVSYGDGQDALRGLSTDPVELAVLDILLPHVDGLTLLDTLRGTHPDMGIILLTALSDVSDRLRGLRAGADDYIAKPFSPAEVVLRVEAVLRRAQPRLPLPLVKAGPIVLNTATHEVRVYDDPVALTPAEYRLLSVLIRQPLQIFSRDQLLDILHGPEGEMSDRTIDVHITRLRKKLGLHPPPIRGVYGVGYQWIGEPGVACDA